MLCKYKQPIFKFKYFNDVYDFIYYKPLENFD